MEKTGSWERRNLNAAMGLDNRQNAIDVPCPSASLARKKMDGGFLAIAIMLREFASCTCRRAIAADSSSIGPLPAIFRYFAAVEAGARRPLRIGGVEEAVAGMAQGFGQLTPDEVAILNALALAADLDACNQRLTWFITSAAKVHVRETAHQALTALNAANLFIEPRL